MIELITVLVIALAITLSLLAAKKIEARQWRREVEHMRLKNYDRDQRQAAVHSWCVAAFGDDHAASIEQRGIRLVEEAIEAGQAAGCSQTMIHRLVDHVFSRPVGELSLEAGGVGITLLALAQAAGFSAELAERIEFTRVLAKPLEHFAARNAAKNAAGFNVIPIRPIPQPE